jgi:hypothetical protein
MTSSTLWWRSQISQEIHLFFQKCRPALVPTKRTGVQSGRGAKMTTHYNPVPRLKMSGVSPILPHLPSRQAEEIHFLYRMTPNEAQSSRNINGVDVD